MKILQDRVAKTLETIQRLYDFKEIIPISAIKGKNIDELIKLIVENITRRTISIIQKI